MENFKNHGISPEEAAKIAKGIMQHRKNQEFLDTNYENLMEKHKGEWVAVVDETVVATNPSFEELFKTLDENKVDRQSSAIRFLDPDPKPMIPSVFKIYE